MSIFNRKFGLSILAALFATVALAQATYTTMSPPGGGPYRYQTVIVGQSGGLYNPLLGNQQVLDSDVPALLADGWTMLPSALSQGTSQFVFNSYASKFFEISQGTASAPVTLNGPTVKISRTEGYKLGACASNYVANECNAALSVASIGIPSDTMQANGINTMASKSSSNAGGNGVNDAVGIASVGVVTGTGTGIGTGAYIQGSRYTTTGSALGIELRSDNETASNCVMNYAGISNCDDMWLTAQSANGSPTNLSSALHVGITGTTNGWLEGVTLNNGSVASIGFNDQSSSTTVLNAGSGHTNIIVSPNFSVTGAGAVSATSISANSFNSSVISNPGSVTSFSIATPGGSGPSFWTADVLAGSNPAFSVTPSNGQGGGGVVTLTSLILFGAPALTGGVGCTVGDTFNIIDPQSGGNLVGGGTLILTATTVVSGAVTVVSVSATAGNAYIWAKPLSSSTAITKRTSTCSTTPTIVLSNGYPSSSFSYANFSASISSAYSITNAGSGYTAPPTLTPSPSFSFVSPSGTLLSVTLGSSMTVGAGNGQAAFNSSGTQLGISGGAGFPVTNVGALIDGTGIRQSLGATYTVPANTDLVRFTQGTTVAASTITLPTAFADGQPIQFVNYAGAVTALTFSPTVNGWTNASTLAAYTGLRVRWDSTAAAWYREQ